MREIKFRGKRKDNKEWVYGNLIKGDEGNYFIIEQSTFPETCIGEIEDLHLYEVIPATIGQYIGKKDKNGEEIYEGGSIMQLSDIFGELKRNAVVEWDDDTVSFIYHDKDGKHWINFKSDLDSNVVVI